MYKTWFDNVVMVQKTNGKLCIYTNYTDLIRHAPNDTYPLSRIDRLVDNTVEIEILSFLDGYSR